MIRCSKKSLKNTIENGFIFKKKLLILDYFFIELNIFKIKFSL